MTPNEITALAVSKTLFDKDQPGSVKGLHVYVLPSGRKPFYVYYRTRGGRERRPKIGEFPETTLAEARRRARLILDRVAVGEDPKGDWDQEKSEPTVGEAFELTVKKIWSKNKSGWGKEAVRLFNKHAAKKFSSMRLIEVTAASVRNWHEALAEETPTTANRALNVLSRVFNLAEEQELIPQATNPCNLVKPKPEKKRKRFATPQELARIIQILNEEKQSHPHAVGYLLTLLFTAARPSEIQKARRDQITLEDFERKTFGVIEFSGKTTAATGEQLTLVLPPQVLAIINETKAPRDGTLFGVKMPHALWKRVSEKAGCPDLWARDFRRTFSTIGLSSGVAIETIGEVLNHKSLETTKIYAQVVNERKVEAVGMIADQIERMVK